MTYGKYMTRGILLACMTVFAQSCRKQNTSCIIGETRNIRNGSMVYLMRYDYRSFSACDSAVISDDSFRFSYKFEDEGVYGISLNKETRRPATFWSENDTLHAILWNNGKAVFNGGEKNALYQNTLNDIENGTLDADTLIERHPESEITAYFLSRYLCMQMDYDSLTSYRKRLEGNKSRYIRQIDIIIESLERINRGAFAPSVSMPGIDGKTKSLADFRNKYTILLFHASWCPDCKDIWPEVYEIYDKYRDKGTELFTVALDTDINTWKRYVAEYKGTHVCDTMQWMSPTVQSYAVRGIPSMFLISPGGKIDMAFCTTESLSLRLKEVFKSKERQSDKTIP